MQIIGYRNLLLGATVAASSTDPVAPVDNLSDGLLFDFWQAGSVGLATIDIDCGAPQAADYIGIAVHNLTLYGLQSSDDGVVYSDVLADVAVDHTSALIATFASVTARYWRVRVDSAGNRPMIAMLNLGRRLEIESPAAGFKSPLLNKKYDRKVSTNASAIPVGMLATTRPTPLSIQGRSLDDVGWRAEQAELEETALNAPFFYAWGAGLNDAVVGWLAGNKPIDVSYTAPGRVNAKIKCDVLV